MATVSADDIWVLARSQDEHPVLVVVGDAVAVVNADTTAAENIVYTRADLIDEYGDQLTEFDVQQLASGLTARLAGDTV